MCFFHILDAACGFSIRLLIYLGTESTVPLRWCLVSSETFNSCIFLSQLSNPAVYTLFILGLSLHPYCIHPRVLFWDFLFLVFMDFELCFPSGVFSWPSCQTFWKLLFLCLGLKNKIVSRKKKSLLFHHPVVTGYFSHKNSRKSICVNYINICTVKYMNSKLGLSSMKYWHGTYEQIRIDLWAVQNVLITFLHKILLR